MTKDDIQKVLFALHIAKNEAAEKEKEKIRQSILKRNANKPV